ncbi:MAG TPA: TonB-dependent receptor [Syntrophales bacterium]|nr:TonB-dependent receptor [Syntrophales bacterium]
MKRLSYLMLSVVILFISTICWAADPASLSSEEQAAVKAKEFEVYNLGEVVVSGEKVKVKEVAIVNEITAEDIKATNSKTVAEALFSAPGVRVTTGSKNTPNVSIHGFAQHRLLVLIDGVPYYETKYGSLDLNQIPTENIAKIEISKGAASVLYGANALGGVINIITKKPSDKPYTSASMEFGENNTQRYSATHGMKKGIFNYWLNYTYATSDGYDLSDDFEPRATTITKKPGGKSTEILQEKGERLNSDYESNNIWAKFGIEPTEDSEYYVNFHYLDRDKAWSPSIESLNYFNSRPYFTQFARIPNYRDWGFDLDAKQKVHDKVTLKAKLFYHNHNDDLDSYTNQTYTTQLAHSTYKDYILGGSFFADYKPIEEDTLRFAVHFKKNNHKQRDDEYLPFEESTSYTGSVSVENEFNLIKNLSVVAGISYDWFDVSKAEQVSTSKSTGDFIEMGENDTTSTEDFNPMIGLTYVFSDETKVFASVAHKSRFPTLNELYGKGSNPNLESEKSWNYTVGVSRPIFTLAKAGLSFFYYDVDDMISKDAPGWLGTNYNVTNVLLYGVEANAEFYPLDGLTLRADYTYEEARNRSEGRVTDHVTNVPKHKVDLGAQYQVPVVRTRLNLNMTCVGETYSELPTPQYPTDPELIASEYTIFDAKVSQPFLKYFEAYVAAKNIFDKNYEPEVGYPAPGRSFWVGISATF